jgi:hypothetical protein
MLDARVVVLERVDLLDFGGEWNWPTLSAGTVVGDAVTWPWELRIGYTPGREFTQALSLTLRMLTANEEGTIIASPQVMAQDGREAEIRVTTEEWFQITSEVGTFLRADLREIETGTILGITPRIGPRGDLTLEMNIEVSDVVARGSSPTSPWSAAARRVRHSRSKAAAPRRWPGSSTPARRLVVGGARRIQHPAAGPRLPHRHPQPSWPARLPCS